MAVHVGIDFGTTNTALALAEDDRARDAWLARHAGGRDGNQRARGRRCTGTRVGDDDAPELREGGSGGECSPREGPDGARGWQEGGGECRLNAKRFGPNRF